MKKLSDIYKELGIAFTFPIVIEDADCNPTYYETIDGFWIKREYDSNGNRTYYENSGGEKRGTPRSQSCAVKIVEVDGKKYKLTEL